jgi:hypothetical protein
VARSTVGEAVREDFAETGSWSRALWHPGVLLVAALLSLVGACVSIGYAWGRSTLVMSAALFLLSTLLAASAGLSLELRRRRPAVGLVAFLCIAFGWIVVAGFLSLIIISASPEGG